MTVEQAVTEMPMVVIMIMTAVAIVAVTVVVTIVAATTAMPIIATTAVPMVATITAGDEVALGQIADSEESDHRVVG